MSELTAYEISKKSREKGRPTAVKYIEKITENFFELHGDRKFGDDKSVVCGVAEIHGKPVTVIGIEKGDSTNEKVLRNFGCAHPEGYRKALRLMRQAEKFRRPVLCFVDTSGAFCGIDAEERGQAEAIADNIMSMMGLKTPILSVVIGEGGSGGALALALADRIWILENAIYSVISPEGCASILWKDAKRVKDAAECLKLTAQDMQELGVVEQVISEEDISAAYAQVRSMLSEELPGLMSLPVKELLGARYERFRRF